MPVSVRGIWLALAALSLTVGCGGGPTSRPDRAKPGQTPGKGRALTVSRGRPATRGVVRRPVARAPLPMGKAQLLYMTYAGDQFQLRLRVIPYPGKERILWRREATADPRGWPGPEAAYTPSPSFTRVLIVWREAAAWESPGEVSVVGLTTGREERIPGGPTFAYWKSDDTFAMLGLESPAQEVTYDLRTHKQTGTRSWPTPVDALRSAFDRPIRAAAAFGAAGRPRADLDPEGMALAVLRGVGLSVAGPLTGVAPGPKSVAATSQDGQYLALTDGTTNVRVIRRGRPVAASTHTIGLTHLVEGEAVSVGDLHWSPDGKSLTFTERHYHPSEYYPPPSYISLVNEQPHPDPLDTTDLVRMFLLDSKRVVTIAVGNKGFVSWTPVFADAR
jgi:hypothetical protein